MGGIVQGNGGQSVGGNGGNGGIFQGGGLFGGFREVSVDEPTGTLAAPSPSTALGDMAALLKLLNGGDAKKRRGVKRGEDSLVFCDMGTEGCFEVREQ